MVKRTADQSVRRVEKMIDCESGHVSFVTCASCCGYVTGCDAYLLKVLLLGPLPFGFAFPPKVRPQPSTVRVHSANITEPVKRT